MSWTFGISASTWNSSSYPIANFVLKSSEFIVNIFDVLVQFMTTYIFIMVSFFYLFFFCGEEKNSFFLTRMTGRHVVFVWRFSRGFDFVYSKSIFFRGIIFPAFEIDLFRGINFRAMVENYYSLVFIIARGFFLKLKLVSYSKIIRKYLSYILVFA